MWTALVSTIADAALNDRSAKWSEQMSLPPRLVQFKRKMLTQRDGHMIAVHVWLSQRECQAGRADFTTLEIGSLAKTVC